MGVIGTKKRDRITLPGDIDPFHHSAYNSSGRGEVKLFPFPPQFTTGIYILPGCLYFFKTV
jgi:hypothetical protein